MTNWLYDALFGPHLASKRPFLIAPDGTATTFEDFLKLAAQMAHALVQQGVMPGESRAVQVEKSQAALALYAACIKSGAVFLPLNTAYTPAEVAVFAEDAGPSLIVCDPSSVAALAPIAQSCGARLETLAADGSGSFVDRARALPERFDPVARGANDTAAILYTSGTTGRSKGAVLSHDNLLSNARALRDIWHFTSADVLLHALPIFHVHGLFVATNVALAAGASMIFLPRFDVAEVLRHLPAATTMMGVPTFYTRLLIHPDFTREAAAHIRLFVSGSAPLLPGNLRRFRGPHGKAHPRALRHDGNRHDHLQPLRRRTPRRDRSAFRCPAFSVRIADPETGAQLTQGETGVIEVSGANVFLGYWRRPELRMSEFRADGYFITGDLGFIDSDGYIFIVGRAKDLIISGGLNVYPKEIETAIDGLDGVVESAVFAVPHSDLGEAVAAAVVAKSQAVTAETIKAGLAGQLAGFKQPKVIFIVDELPRNAMGKVQKNILRERYNGHFA